MAKPKNFRATNLRYAAIADPKVRRPTTTKMHTRDQHLDSPAGRPGVLCVLIVLCASAACKPNSAAAPASDVVPLAPSEHALTGTSAPSFELELASRPGIAGQSRVSLNELRGKVVLLDFWATWCKPCRVSFPHYQKLTEEFGEALRLVAISEDDERDGLLPFLEETGAEFDVGWDSDNSIAGQYQLGGMPTLFVIDPHGIIQNVHTGFLPGDEDQIRATVALLLQQ